MPRQSLVSIRQRGETLTMGTPDGIITWVQIRAVLWPHIWLNGLHVLTLRVTHRVSGRVGEGTPSCCSIHLMCNGHIWLGSRTASLGQGSCHGSTCCLPHPRLLQRKRLLSCPCTTRRPTRHHNTAAEMLWLYCHSLDGATLVYPKLIQINYGVMLRMKCR